MDFDFGVLAAPLRSLPAGPPGDSVTESDLCIAAQPVLLRQAGCREPAHAVRHLNRPEDAVGLAAHPGQHCRVEFVQVAVDLLRPTAPRRHRDVPAYRAGRLGAGVGEEAQVIQARS